MKNCYLLSGYKIKSAEYKSIGIFEYVYSSDLYTMGRTWHKVN